MDVDTAAEELYAAALADFTARRNALAKEAADDGDPGTAQHIRSLAKPSLAAWVTNQLVRNHRTEIDGLLQLGESLRDATSRLSRDDLSALSKQQRDVVGALVKVAVTDAADAGQQVSATVARSVEQTLRAALGDQGSGELLAAGRLTEPLEYIGFPGGISTAAPSTSTASTPARSPARTADRKDEAKEQAALAARAEAREALGAATRERDAASQAVAAAEQRVELLTGHLDEVQRRAKELAGQLRAAQRDQRAAEKAREQADDAVGAAEQRLHEVT